MDGLGMSLEVAAISPQAALQRLLATVRYRNQEGEQFAW